MGTCLVWEPKELLVTICVMCGVFKKKSKTFSHSNLPDPTFKVFLGMPCIAPDCSLFVLTSWSSNLHKEQSSKFCFRLIHILHPWSLPVMRTGIYPSCHWSRSRVHPGQVASITQSLHRETHNMTFTFTPDSESWVISTWISLTSETKLKYSERTQAATVTTCKLHRGTGPQGQTELCQNFSMTPYIFIGWLSYQKQFVQTTQLLCHHLMFFTPLHLNTLLKGLAGQAAHKP